MRHSGAFHFLTLFFFLLLTAACGGAEYDIAPEEAVEETAAELEEATAEAPTEEPAAEAAEEAAEEPMPEEEMAEEEAMPGEPPPAGQPVPATATPIPLQPTPPAAAAAPLPTPDWGRMTYDVPHEMVRSETKQVILLMDPSGAQELEAILEEELAEAGQEPSDVRTVDIEVARRMSARLLSVPPDAFTIENVHATPEQPLHEDRVTRWEWSVTPLKQGRHRLDLVVYRVVQRDNVVEHEWDEVYRDDVTVNVTLRQRVVDAWAGFDFKWIIGALFVPFFLYYLSRRESGR